MLVTTLCHEHFLPPATLCHMHLVSLATFCHIHFLSLCDFESHAPGVASDFVWYVSHAFSVAMRLWVTCTWCRKRLCVICVTCIFCRWRFCVNALTRQMRDCLISGIVLPLVVQRLPQNTKQLLKQRREGLPLSHRDNKSRQHWFRLPFSLPC